MAAPRKPTSRDVARLAGVSQATVSRVLQDSPLVQAATREAVLQAISMSGYAPNAAARSMRTRRSGTIALVVANLSVNPLYTAMLQLLFAALRRRGLTASVWEEEDFDDRSLQVVIESGVDGVITTTAMESTRPFLESIAEHLPVVLLHRTLASDAFDQFASDNRASGEAVASFLMARGRRRIGLISGHALPNTLAEREAGFIATLNAAGIELKPKRIARVPRFSYESGSEAARRLVSGAKVDTIFCVNDIAAVGALDGVRALGLTIPEQAWVVGVDDIPMASWGCIDLTTITQSRQALVDAAVERLVERIAQPDLKPVRVMVPYSLVERGSTA